ncbi:MAG TPA: ShlB/FhaC/HecB family hemolysin secretion/activation protein [Gammaproteobacteria bacterium]|nr:ShlB/FhaC/HecB family hemolysin secretion/activation protein [Gammaproteobacteria bacterium]
MKGGAPRSTVAFVTVLLFSTAVSAAPGAPTPGQVQSTLPKQPVQPKKAPPPTVSSAPANPAGVAPGGPAVKVGGFDIEGNSVIPSDVLQAQVAGYVGQSLTLAQLYDVADVLTRYYRAQGYGLAYVSLPAQTLKGGTVRLQVIEGKIGTVSVQGNTRTRTRVLERRAGSLQPGEIYTNADAERAVLQMDALPGVTARAVLSPGSDFGTSNVLFNVDEHPYAGDISVDDYGRAAIGRWRVNGNVFINGLTGSGDQLLASVTHAEGNLLNYGRLNYQFPTGDSSELSFGYNRAHYRVGQGPFAALGISGSTQNGNVNWQDDVERTREETLNWGVGVSHNTSKNEVSGNTQVTTNITLLQLTMLYNRQREDQSYYTLSGSLWTNGRHNDGSSNSAERLRVELDGNYFTPMGERWQLTAQGTLTYSVDPLVDGDKYSLGGPGNVRGFQSAEVRGDSGVFGSLEVLRSLTTSPSFPLAWGLFWDAGKVWSKSSDPQSTNYGVRDSTGIASLGTELQLQPSLTGWNARLQFAWAVGGYRPSDDVSTAAVALGAKPADRGPHIWFTLGKSF